MGLTESNPVIQQKPEFFQGLLFQQMCFIQDADHLFMLDTMDDLDLLLELGVSSRPGKTGIPIPTDPAGLCKTTAESAWNRKGTG